VLSSLLLPQHVSEIETIFVRAIRKIYTPALEFSLAHRWIIVAAGLGFLAATGALIPYLGSEFLPTLEEGNYWIRAALPPSMTLDAGTDATRKMREILLSHPEVRTTVSQHGRPDNGSDASPFSNVEIFAPLKPESIPIALFFAVIALVIQGESANLLSVGAVDFGIIVDSAVILVEKQVVDAIEASFDNPTTLQSAARNVELPQSASLEIVASGP
jgi:Cu/Ag efflux pump CusA